MAMRRAKQTEMMTTTAVEDAGHAAGSPSRVSADPAGSNMLRRAACISLTRLLAETGGLPKHCPDPNCRRNGRCRAEDIDDMDPVCREQWPPVLFALLVGGIIGVNHALDQAEASPRRSADRRRTRSGREAAARA